MSSEFKSGEFQVGSMDFNNSLNITDNLKKKSSNTKSYYFSFHISKNLFKSK